jgi:myo-inositol-1(or 4)-monophosphatase
VSGGDVPLDELLALAVEAAREVADLHRRRAGDLGAVATKSTVTDIVTEVDRRSEELLVELLLSRRPDDGLLGEEGADVAGTSGVRWVVDPLDGTVNYAYGQPPWSVSIAADVDGVPTVGVVLDSSRDDLFTAVRGRGATLGGRTLRLGPPPPLERALLATGFSYRAERRAAQADVLRQVIPVVRDVRRTGSAAVDLSAVAAGRVDGYYEWGLNPWDLAAGRLVAVEAGARATTLADGTEVVAAPPLFEALIELLESHPLG